MAQRTAFTDDDVRQLLRGPSDDERAAAAYRLCRRIDSQLGEADRDAAGEILRLMAADAAELVRRALAVTLRASPKLPRDVALKLAADIDSIALPVLNFSPVFTDADLCEIVRMAGPAKQVAVARRPALAEEVTRVIANRGCEAAVEAVVGNAGAVFSERGLRATLDRFAHSEAVTLGLAYRKSLPLSIAERLVGLVSDEVRRHLVDRHALSPETAMEIALDARERATIDLVEQADRAADLPAFAAHLHAEARLTASLLLRAIARGRIRFFEHGLAVLAGVPHHRAWLLVHDAGPRGLAAICSKAGLPMQLAPAFRAGVDAFRALQFEGVDDPERLQQLMLQRFLTQPNPVSRDEVDYLMARLDRVEPADQAHTPELLRGAA